MASATQQARKRDVKMKVKDKTKTTKIHQFNTNIGSAGFTSNNLEPLQLPLKNGDIEIIQPTFLNLIEVYLEKDTIHITTSNNEICDIVLEDRDILQLFKDYLGQEEFRQNELISLRKKVEAQEKPLVGIENAYEDVREMNKDNQVWGGMRFEPDNCIPFTEDSPRTDKDIENQKIVDGLLASLQEARSFDKHVELKTVETYQEYLDMLREELKRITGKAIKDL